MSSPIPLPRHILSIIASSLDPLHDRPTLIALRLANKDAYAAAVPILYREVVISSHGVHGLLGLKPRKGILWTLINTLSPGRDFETSTETDDTGCTVFDMEKLTEEVMESKRTGTFYLSSNASVRRLYHLSFVRHLRIEDVDVGHPFWIINFSRPPVVEPAAADPIAEDSNAALPPPPPPPPRGSTMFAQVESVSFGPNTVFSSEDSIKCASTLGLMLEDKIRHMCVANSSILSAPCYELIPNVFEYPSNPSNLDESVSENNGVRKGGITLTCHNVDDLRLNIGSIRNLTCGLKAEIVTRHPTIEADGYAQFTPYKGSYTRSGNLIKANWVKDWERQSEWIYNWVRQESRKIDLILEFQQIDPRGQRYDMRRKDQEVVKEYLDPFIQRRLKTFDTETEKFGERVRTHLKGDLECPACGLEV